MSFFLPEDYITILDQLLSRVLQKQQYLLVWCLDTQSSSLSLRSFNSKGFER